MLGLVAMKKLIFWLLVFVGLAAVQFRRFGPYASFGIGFFLMPIIFILQLMLARCFGFHRQMPTDDTSDDHNRSKPSQ